MKKKLPFTLSKILIITLGLFLSTFTIKAAWVENIPTTVKNPDGTEIECFASGDEFFNYLHDKGGFTIIQDNDGYYYYAVTSGDTLRASSYRVGVADPDKTRLTPFASISEQEYQRRKDEMFKNIDINTEKVGHSGTLNNLAIYIRFSDDVEFTSPRSTFETRMNQNANPSVKDYFQEVSYGKITVQSHHFPESAMEINISYQDPYPRSYFQPYNSTTNPNGYTAAERTSREHQLLHRAVSAVSSAIPASLNIDNDNDGRVDNVCFIIKGGNGAWSSILWAHRWALYSTSTYINGKRVWDYTFQPETQATVQILNHELFHTFGAPDLYRYSNTSITPVGPWDLMHSGSGHMGAFMKWKYTNQTWIEDIPTISEPGTYSLNPLTSSENNAYRINSPNSSSEYFVVEYRKKITGTYEAGLPDSGLLIYKINTLAGNGNANGPPDEVYLYRPNGTLTLNGIASLANYSASSGRTEINDNTNPSSFLSDGSASGLDISNISDAGNTISFDLMGGSSVSWDITLEASPEHGGTVTGQGTYYQGNTVSITATAAQNFSFQNWTENGTIVSSQPNYSFIANNNRHLVANFVSATPVYNISLLANPEEGGILSGDGNYFEGENVTLEAIAAEGYNFINWTENGNVVSTLSQFSITADENRSFIANFQLQTHNINLSASPVNGGNLSGAGTYDHGTVRSVLALSADGYDFVNWTENGNIVTTNAQYMFQLLEDRNLTANFQSVQATDHLISLTANPIEGGTLSGGGEYSDGQTATVSASAASGYAFVNWTENGSVVSSQASYNFIVTEDRTITANFTLNSYTLALNADPAIGGTVSGGGNFAFGQTATVSASAASGYAFVNWTENGSVVSSQASYNFIVAGDRTLTANFTLNSYTLALNADPAIGGTVSGGGNFAFGQTATVSASAASGYTFVNWTDNGSVVSSQASYNFIVAGDRTLTANFTLNSYTLALNADPAIGGTVSGGGNFAFGQTATVSASAASGYTFVNWTDNGSVVSSQASYNFSVTGDRTLTANFTLNSYTLALNADPAIGGTVSGGGNFAFGQTATVSASAASGYTFVNWTYNGSVVSSQANYNFSVTGDRTLTANFTLNSYTLALNADPAIGGTVSGGGNFAFGQTATVSASAASGYTFVNWTDNGSVVSSQATYNFSVTGDRTLTANFTLDSYTLALNADPAIGGTVSGGGNFAFGQTATVSASAASGYTFVNWTDNGSVVSSQATYNFSVTGDRTLTANFTLNSYTLALNADPAIGGTVSGGGNFAFGQTATVSASAASGYTFVNWTDNGSVVSSQATYNFSVTGDRTLTANFTLNSYTLALNADPAIGGTVSGGGNFAFGQTATVSASAASGYTFVNWTDNGSVVSSQATYNFSVTGDRTLTANFTLNSYTLALNADPAIGGTVSGGGNFAFGQTATVSASAASGYTFVNWTDNGSVVSSQANYNFSVTGDRTLTANFTLNSYTLALNADPAIGGTVSGGGNFALGQTTTVSASAASGYTFVNWTENGSVVSSQATYNFTVTGDRTLTANFTPNSYTIALNADPAIGGTVSGGGNFAFGQTTTVSASAASGYTFVNWTENGSVVSSQATYNFSVTGDRTLTANFTLNSYTIALNADPAIGGTVSGGGNFAFGQTTTIAAIPFTDYRFVRWEENGLMLSEQIIFTLEIINNREITAVFELMAHTVKIDAHSSPSGFAFINGAGIYEENETVQLKAVPIDNSFTFLGWEENGEIISQQNIMEFSATQDRSVVARFEQQSRFFDIAARYNDIEEIKVTGTGTYHEGENATLEIQTPEHIKFVGWRNSAGQITSRSNPYTFTVTRNITLEAITQIDESPLVPNEFVSVFPNPSNGDFKIMVEEAWKLEIRNSSGFLVWEQEIEAGITEINLNQWPIGMYIINLQNDKSKKTEKIIIN